MSQGKVKWFNKRKGYGFIAQDNGEDLFVHHSEVRGRDLIDGDAVEFEVGRGPKGQYAVDVKLVES